MTFQSETWTDDPAWRDLAHAVITASGRRCWVCGYHCRSMHAIPYDRTRPYDALVPVCGACKSKLRSYARLPENVCAVMRDRKLGQPTVRPERKPKVLKTQNDRILFTRTNGGEVKA